MQETILRNTEFTPNKAEMAGVHANAILQRGIANANDINKWMDALCSDPDICKGILGESVYESCKDELKTSKKIIDINDDNFLENLPEFDLFLKSYTLKKQKESQILEQSSELAAKLNILNEIDLPEELKNRKDTIIELKNTIREILSEKDEKIKGNRRTFIDHCKSSAVENSEKGKYLNMIYNFIFEYVDKNSAKKKTRKKDESSVDFYKRIGEDFVISTVIDSIQKEEKNNNNKIKSFREKTKQKINTSINNKKKNGLSEEKDYKEEALKEFKQTIRDNSSLRGRFYIPEERSEIECIQSYFKRHMQETISFPDIESISSSIDIQANTINKTNGVIHMNTNDYLEIRRRIRDYKDKFDKKLRNPREYLFDRLIEYVGKDILKYEIQENINQYNEYRGTTFEIFKTDALDDTSAGADYVVIFKNKYEARGKIAAIDLFVSEKEVKDDSNLLQDGSLEQKLEKSKINKIPYSTYINLFLDTDEKSFSMAPLHRYVEQQSPTLLYTILREILKDKNESVENLMKSLEKKGKLYSLIPDTKSIQRIEKDVKQNKLRELEKLSA